MPELKVRLVEKEPKTIGWNYPTYELDYLLEQIAAGDREEGCTLELYNGRLYEVEE